MSERTNRAELLAEQLVLPPGARQTNDTALHELLILAEQVSSQWYAIEPSDEALTRILDQARKQAGGRLERRMRWRPTLRLPRFGWTTRVATGLAVVAAVALAVNLLSGGQEPSDRTILARAEAAIAPAGQIVFIERELSSTTTEPLLNTKQTVTTKSEIWTYRDRLHSLTTAGSVTRDGKRIDNPSLVGLESMIEGSEVKTYTPLTNTIAVVKLKEEAGPNQDPIAGVRASLSRPGVDVTEKTEIKGVTAYAIELPPQTTDLVGVEATTRTVTTYYVQADNYRPLEIHTRTTVKGEQLDKLGALGRPTSSVMRILDYQLLEPKESNLALLELKPHPHAKEVTPGTPKSP